MDASQGSGSTNFVRFPAPSMTMPKLPTAQTDAAEEKPEIVKKLEAIDDKYLELQRKFDKELHELAKKYTEMQKPLLEERSTKLQGEGGGETGTPAVEGFWLKAFKNHPHLSEAIEEWDEPVLMYLKDVKCEDIDPDDSDKGFKLEFIFAENPYFTNTVVTKEYRTKEGCPYRQEIDCTETVGCSIEWKPGKDVTVEKVQKKVKGGGAKKAKQKAQSKEEPRSSFFRSMFRTMSKSGSIPDDFDPEEYVEATGNEDFDEDELREFILESDLEVGQEFRDKIIPYAVRWYTGEAAPEDDSDFDEDGEEEDDDDDDDDDEEDSDEDDVPLRGRGGKAGRGGAKNKAKSSGGNNEGEKKEECKQQ